MTNQHPGGIPTACTTCGAELHAHNVTGYCRECKLIARNQRLSANHNSAGQVGHDEAINNVTTILGGRIIAEYTA